MRTVIVIVIALALAAAALLWHGEGNREKSEKPIKPPSDVSHNSAGEAIVKLAAEARERAGLRVEVVAAHSEAGEIAAYGRLQEDPSRSYVVRSPASGIIRASGEWPALGRVTGASAALGSVVPRLSVAERVGLNDRLATARADAASAEAALRASRAAWERARVLNADAKNVSDRALQEAEARMKSDEARAAAANRSIALYQAAVSGSSFALDSGPGGETVEVAAQPGENVEPGQTLIRLARFDTLIARVELPPGEPVPAATAARIVVLGREARPLRGERIMAAPSSDPNAPGQPLLFRVRGNDPALRPGLPVTAFIASGAAPASAVPQAAIVRTEGRLWAFVETSPGEYVRRELPALRPGDRVVVEGAQLLLSEESKSHVRVGEESGG